MRHKIFWAGFFVLSGFSCWANEAQTDGQPHECVRTTTGMPAVNSDSAIQACDAVPIQFSYVDTNTGTSENWAGQAPFDNQVINRSGISSLQDLDPIPVIPGGNALGALGSRYSDLYQNLQTRGKFTAMESSFKKDFFGAINDAESKIAAVLGTDYKTLENNSGHAQYISAFAVFDPKHPQNLPKSMIFGGSMCAHSNGKFNGGSYQVGKPADCPDGQMVEVFTVYSLNFNPDARPGVLGLTLKSAGMQITNAGSAPQTQIGASLSGLNTGH